MGKSPIIEQLRASAIAAKNYAIGLVLQFAENTGKDLEAMEVRKADKPTAVSCTIPATGWKEDGTAGYPQYYDLPISGVTASDRAEVTLAPSGLETAAKCGMCQTCETMNGKIRLRAARVPEAAIAAEYWIEKGKE